MTAAGQLMMNRIVMIPMTMKAVIEILIVLPETMVLTLTLGSRRRLWSKNE